MISMWRKFFLFSFFLCVTMLEKTCAIDIDPKIFLLAENLSVLAYKLTLAALYFVMFLNHFFKTYLKRGRN